MIEIAAGGPFTVQTRTGIASAVRKALAQRPRAVLLDLVATDGAAGDLAPVVLLAEAQSAHLQPPVPILVVAAPAQARRLSALTSRIPVEPTRAAALARLAGTAPAYGQARADLQPIPLAAAEARNLVGDACLSWGLSRALHPARLIVSELATNALEHARTPFTVTLTRRRPDLLHLAVEDSGPGAPLLRPPPEDPRAPLAMRGKGLRLVDASATAWGSGRTAAGKVVWATLRVSPD